MKKSCLSIFLMVIWFSLTAQNYEKERIIPPNPIAASFKLYNDIPVSYNTGVPDITIPLYMIQIGDFSIPIELKYHINSVKPGSCRSNVALGWTLQYGGIISRTVYGKPDDRYDGITTFGTGVGVSNNEILKDIVSTDYVGGWDSEYDIFNYNIPGASGQFILDDVTPYLMSQHPVSIKYLDDGIDVLNDDGHVFKFGYGEKESTFIGSQSFTSSWLLSQIDLASNRTVTFLYQDIPYYSTFPYEKQLSIMDDLNFYAYNTNSAPWVNVGPGPSVCEGPTDVIMDPLNVMGHLEKNISEIHFPNGKVVFDLTSDKRIITGLRVYSGSDLIKSYQFENSTTGGSMGGMKLLRKILLKDRLLNEVSEYQFNYYDEAVISENVNTDYWGFYNGSDENYFPFDVYTIEGPASPCDDGIGYPYTFTGGRSKESILGFSRINVLQKIIYPTGGSTEFEYGLNEYRFNGQVKQGNGLRVKKVITNNNDGLTTTKTFQYEPQDRNGDYIYQVNNFVSTRYTVGTIPYAFQNGISRARHRTYSPSTSSRIANYLLNIQYSKVTEIIGDETNNIGKNVYYYQYSNDHERTELASQIPISDFVGASFSLSRYRNWDNGLLFRKEIYKKDEPQPTLVNSYTYEHHYDPPFRNTFAFQISSYPGNTDDSTTRELIISNSVGILGPLSEEELLYLFPPIYGYCNYDIVTGWLELKQEVTTEYRNGNSISTSTNYEYGGVTKYYASRKISTTSEGVDLVTDMKYPYDFPETAPYSSMISRNIISPVIELLSYKGTTPLQSIKTNYWDWGNNVFAPKSIEHKTGTNSYETRLNYHSYDNKGNVLSASEEDNLKTSYLWDYGQTLPIAKVANAAVDQIAYSSFESDGYGNWSVNGIIHEDNTSRTGRRCLELTSLERTGLSPSAVYILSYWYNPGAAIAITGMTSSDIQTSLGPNGWTFVTRRVTGGATLTISGTGRIDEVRLYPADAQMTTYTYDPLIGLTSSTDANGISTYFEYDDFRRLAIIKDDKGNVVKRFAYHYKGQ